MMTSPTRSHAHHWRLGVPRDGVVRGQTPDLAEHICCLPSCTTSFTPVQPHQKFCTPSHRYDGSRLRHALPVAQRYLQDVLDQLVDDPVVPS